MAGLVTRDAVQVIFNITKPVLTIALSIHKYFGEISMIFRRSKTTAPDNPMNLNGTHKPAGPSIIAQDVVIEGNVATSGELHIDGTVYGAIRASSCVVDLNGFVQGEILANEVFVRGRVVGPISGNTVNLYAGAQVEGDIINQTISIENGANVYGMISRMEGPMLDLAASLQHQNAPGGYNPPALPYSSLEESYESPLDQSFEPRTPKPRLP